MNYKITNYGEFEIVNLSALIINMGQLTVDNKNIN